MEQKELGWLKRGQILAAGKCFICVSISSIFSIVDNFL
jgi:hypothetical protein